MPRRNENEQSLKIDAHHHLWPGILPWMEDGMEILKRPYLPQELKNEMDRAGIDGSVVVQAQQNQMEIPWLLGLADDYPFIYGVVGWADLKRSDIGETLARYASDPRFVGVREITQGAHEDKYFADADFNRGVDALKGLNLAYDILVYHRQLPDAIRFVDRHPNLRFVLDHIGKPDIKGGSILEWKDHMNELARRENVYCKLSGVVTEAGADWSPPQIEPYMDAALGSFGSGRLLFGSDWPICRLRCEYGDWLGASLQYISKLSADERGKILGGNAIRAYNLRI